MDWPWSLRDCAQTIRAVMTHAEEPLTVEQVAQHFYRARRKDVESLLGVLEGLGLVEQTDGRCLEVWLIYCLSAR